MKIYLVRHGQTNWNIENRLQGCVDIPLNDTGIKQAHMLADNIQSLEYDLIISSPLCRALDTANIINQKRQIPLITSNQLLERSFGLLEGIYGTEYDKDLYWDYSKNYTYKDVEPVQTFFNRIYAYMNTLKNSYPNKNLLLVTHNGVNIATNCYFNGLPANQNLLSIQLDNCSYAEYDFDRILNKDKSSHNFER